MSTVAPLTFSITQILKDSWQLLKKQWAFLLGLWSAMVVVMVIVGSIQAAIGKDNSTLELLVWLASQVLITILEIGTIKIILKLVRGETAEMKELFSGTSYLMQYILAGLVTSIVIIFGLLLLIAPGIIWGIKYMFTMFLVVDEKLQFSEAMAKSAEMTQGIKWKLYGFGWAMLGINLLGCLPLFLGLFITIPVTSLAVYVLYVQLKDQLKNQPALKTAA